MLKVEEAYTALEIASFTGKSKQHVRRLAVAEGWPSRQRTGRGGGDEYFFATLPEAMRQKILRGIERQSFDSFCQEGGKKRLIAAVTAQKGLKALYTLPPTLRKRAEARAAIVGAFKEYYSITPLGACEARAAFARLYAEGTIAIEGGVRDIVPSFHPNSLLNWCKTLAEQGIAALGGVYKSPQKGKGVLDLHTELREYIIGRKARLYGDSISSIYEDLPATFPGLAVPSLRHIQKWWRGYAQAHAAALQKYTDPDGYKSHLQVAFGSAAEDVVRPNQLWELDSSPTDILLEDGERHAVLACIDVYTRRAMVHVAHTSTAAAVCALLFKCLLAWGVPENIHTDNGADYASEQVRLAVIALGFKQDFCPPFTPEKKPHVERFFGTFNRRLAKVPGFIGHCVADRKKIEGRKRFSERLALKKKEKKVVEFRLSAEAFQEYSDTWTAFVYGERRHKGIGASPNAFYAESGFHPVKIEDERALDILLMPVAGKGIYTVQKKGLLINKGAYIAPALGAYVGQEVFVTYADGEKGYVYVYTLDRAFICKAEDCRLTGEPVYPIAVAAKAVARSQRAAGNREVKEAGDKIEPQKILETIMPYFKAKGEAAQAARPQEHIVQSYSTPELAEAGKAARAGYVMPKPLFTPEQQARLAAKEAKSAAAASSPNLSFTAYPADAYANYLILLEKQEKGAVLTAEEAQWLKGFTLSSIYKYYDRVIKAQDGVLPADVLQSLGGLKKLEETPFTKAGASAPVAMQA